jgi:hypothetical protein
LVLVDIAVRDGYIIGDVVSVRGDLSRVLGNKLCPVSPILQLPSSQDLQSSRSYSQ